MHPDGVIDHSKLSISDGVISREKPFRLDLSKMEYCLVAIILILF